jgi:hypothetical protein
MQKTISGYKFQSELDTKTYWLTDWLTDWLSVVTLTLTLTRASGSIVGWGTVLQAGTFSGSNPSEVTSVYFSNDLTLPSALWLRGRSNLSGDKGPTDERDWHHRHLCTDCAEVVEASTSHNTMGVRQLVKEVASLYMRWCKVSLRSTGILGGSGRAQRFVLPCSLQWTQYRGLRTEDRQQEGD